ncbi:MAG TPA: hypothetical protein VLF61_00565 [Rhabdochlamydiaceae bacterium]|nr:hypothetical protein [Rhabdochlamydiaceae bacterium]
MKNFWKSPLLKLFLFVVGFICIERFCHNITEGFRPHKILSTLPFNPDYATEPATEEVKKLLAQPFYFLSSGGQCYAFISQDQKTILKVFKHHHMRPESILNHVPLPSFLEPLRTKIVQERIERLHSIFSSFKLAHDRFKERTGLLYLHLNKTDDLQQTLTLVDSIGIAHTFDVDQLEFALQKKAILAYPKIHQCMKTGDRETAKACLKSLVELIVERSRAGLADRDPIVKRNFGFIDETAVEIDLGSFYEDALLTKPVAYKRELFFECIKLKSWVKKRYPELYPFLEETVRHEIEKD